MQLTYYDGVKSITMPPSRPYTIGYKQEGIDITLAGGRQVSEMKGYRIVFSIKWDWVPVDTLRDLLKMLRENPFLDVTYHDPVDGMKTRRFKVAFSDVKTWRYYDDGTPRYHDITITHASQELVRQ